MCIKFLDEHGKRMKEALKIMGEEDDEEQQATEDQPMASS